MKDSSAIRTGHVAAIRLTQLLGGTRAPICAFADERLTSCCSGCARVVTRRRSTRPSEYVGGRLDEAQADRRHRRRPHVARSFAALVETVPDAPDEIVEALCEHAGPSIEARLIAVLSVYDRHTAVEFSGVSKRFNAGWVLDDVNLALPEGATTAVVGESGSGKSTLLQLMNAVYRADKGTVKVFGRNRFRSGDCICGAERSAMRYRVQGCFRI